MGQALATDLVVLTKSISCLEIGCLQVNTQLDKNRRQTNHFLSISTALTMNQRRGERDN